jgi:hypothetical protein
MKALILAASLLIAGAANAQTCETPASVVGEVRANVPAAKVIAEMSGDQAQIIISKFNALPPASDERAESVTVMYASGLPTVLFILHLAGCVVITGEVPVPVFLAWTGRGA